MKGKPLKSCIATASSIFVIASLAGCASLHSPISEPLSSDGYTNTSGSPQLLKEASFEKINLPSLLDPDHKRDKRRRLRAEPTGATDPAAGSPEELDEAFAAFYLYDDLNERRNRVQDRVLAASEQRCNVYKNYLRRVDTYQETATGILATIFGGAGAIATGVTRARTLSGLGGITSGIGAELKQGYFSNIATQIIVPGIDLARSDIRRDILARRGETTRTYTVEAALQDAARYHGACSLNTGLERSGVAVKEVQNPGIASFNRFMKQQILSGKLMRRMTDENVTITEDDLRLADDVTGTTGGGALSGPLLSRSYFDRYIATVSEAKNNLASLENAIDAQIVDNIAAAKSSGEDISVPAIEACNTLKKENDRCLANFALQAIKDSGTMGKLEIALNAKLDDQSIDYVLGLDKAMNQKSEGVAPAGDADKVKEQPELDLMRARDIEFKKKIYKFGLLADEIRQTRAKLPRVNRAEDLEPNLQHIADLLK